MCLNFPEFSLVRVANPQQFCHFIYLNFLEFSLVRVANPQQFCHFIYLNFLEFSSELESPIPNNFETFRTASSKPTRGQKVPS